MSLRITSSVMQDNTLNYLYLYGIMVLLSEVLRSAVQEPVFFVLFQQAEYAVLGAIAGQVFHVVRLGHQALQTKKAGTKRGQPFGRL